MLKVLIETSLKRYLKPSSRKKGRFSIPQWVILAGVTLLMTAVFYKPCENIAIGLQSMRLQKLYFTLVYILSSTILLISNVVMAQNTLFKSKYNDMILSMPINDLDILLSRIAEMYFQNLMTELMSWLPATVGWISALGFRIGEIIAILIGLLFTPGLFIALGSLIGYLLSRITVKMRHPNIVRFILTFGFLGAYYYLIFNSEDLIADLIYNSNHISDVFSWLISANWLGIAVAEGKIKYLLFFILFNVGAISLMILLLEKGYRGLMTASQSKADKVYVKKEMHVRGQMTALIMRELKHFFSNYTYMINTCISLVFILAGTVFLIINSKDLMSAFTLGDRELIVMIICFMAILTVETTGGMFFVSSCLISIEGENIYNLRALPVSERQILASKLLFHYGLGALFILVPSLTTVILFKPDLLMGLLTVLIPQVYLFMTGALGLCYNLKYYKLDWTNEAQVVKRGMAVFLSMMSNLIIIGLQVAPYIIWVYDIAEVRIYALGVFAVMVVISCGLTYLIMNWGKNRLQQIGG